MPTRTRGLIGRHRVALAALSALGVAAAVSSQTAFAATSDAVSVHDIQGAAHRSAMTGQQVSDVAGVVTAVSRNGFWMQDPEPDDDPGTSEGIFVFTRSAPAVTARDAVTVSGRVAEFRPGFDATNLTTTELTSPTVTVVGDADLPTPTLVGPGGRLAPPKPRADAPDDVERGPFDASAHALDFYESMEGMLVRVADAVASGPTNRFGELSVLPGGAGEPRTARGGIRYTHADPNTERVILDDRLADPPVANTGDTLPGDVDGVLDYSFGNFKLLALATPTVKSGDLPRETTRPHASNELAIATYNVENLDPRDSQEHFDNLARDIVEHLATPDIVTVEEIQDNSGRRNNGVVDADATYRKLIDAIAAAGGPTYDYRQVNPENNADGGQPGGNIRVGFLFRTDRELEFVDRPGGDAATPTRAVEVDNRAALSLSPGRIDPGDPAWEDSRKPLAGEFRFRGKTFIVIANHFNSKGGDRPLMGRYQPPFRPSETQRHAQAKVLRGFLDDVFAIEPGANVVVTGDINDFEFSRTADILVGDGSMIDLPRTLPENERYSYVFDGNSQVLDHILLSRSLAGSFEYDIVHLNAEYHDQSSDHDPQVVRLRARPGGRGHG